MYASASVATPLSCADAESLARSMCFELRPPGQIGAELEWLSDVQGRRPGAECLRSALGPYAPPSVGGAGRPLRRGSTVTIEPGGQVEISSLPAGDPVQLCSDVAADFGELRARLSAAGVGLSDAAADDRRLPHRVLDAPRYRAMERLFGGIGPFGTVMMCNTAAVQVSVDAGADAAEVAARWRMLHAVGPAMVAAFACSPVVAGAPAGQWASQRMRAWLHLDPARTDAPGQGSADPIADYARWALSVPLMCVPGAAGCDWTAPSGMSFADWLEDGHRSPIGRAPTPDDLKYHLSTLFPPVRASGHLEVRYVDAQPGDGWIAPIALFAGLTSTPGIVAQATAVADSTATSPGRWHDAARRGLADEELRVAAVELFELAAGALETWPQGAEYLYRAARRCAAGRTPTGEIAHAVD